MSAPSEFLPGPSWRRRVGPARRRAAIVLSFALMVAVGGALLVLLAVVAGALGAPTAVVVAGWAVPTAAAGTWALRTSVPASVDEDASQSWTEYVLRAVMVGSESVRPVPRRLVTAVLFGAPIASYALVVVMLAAAGLG